MPICVLLSEVLPAQRGQVATETTYLTEMDTHQSFIGKEDLLAHARIDYT